MHYYNDFIVYISQLDWWSIFSQMAVVGGAIALVITIYNIFIAPLFRMFLKTQEEKVAEKLQDMMGQQSDMLAQHQKALEEFRDIISDTSSSKKNDSYDRKTLVPIETSTQGSIIEDNNRFKPEEDCFTENMMLGDKFLNIGDITSAAVMIKAAQKIAESKISELTDG